MLWNSSFSKTPRPNTNLKLYYFNTFRLYRTSWQDRRMFSFRVHPNVLYSIQKLIKLFTGWLVVSVKRFFRANCKVFEIKWWIYISEAFLLIFKMAAVNYNIVRDQRCRLASNLVSIFLFQKSLARSKISNNFQILIFTLSLYVI